MSPPRAARGRVGPSGHAAEVLPSFLQRAIAAAAPAEGEATEPLPTAPTQDSPLKPRPQERHADAQPDSGKGQGCGIVALPPVSQLDQSVLDSLPLVTRRELEMAYGAQPLRSVMTICAPCCLQNVPLQGSSLFGHF